MWLLWQQEYEDRTLLGVFRTHAEAAQAQQVLVRHYRALTDEERARTGPQQLADVREVMPEASEVIDRYMGYGKVVAEKASLESPMWGVDMAANEEYEAQRAVMPFNEDIDPMRGTPSAAMLGFAVENWLKMHPEGRVEIVSE